MADVTTATDQGRAAGRASRPARVRPPQKFRHFHPDDQKGGKGIVRLAQTDLIRGVVQVVKKGEGDNNLHIHTGMDGFWMVLKGKVRFYGPDDVVLGDFGPNEGILMPRGNAYWFAAIGEEDLEILQVVSYDKDVKNERVDVNPQRFDTESAEYFDGRVE